MMVTEELAKSRRKWVYPLLTGSDTWKLEGMGKSEVNDSSQDFGRCVHGSDIPLAEEPGRRIVRSGGGERENQRCYMSSIRYRDDFAVEPEYVKA